MNCQVRSRSAGTWTRRNRNFDIPIRRPLNCLNYESLKLYEKLFRKMFKKFRLIPNLFRFFLQIGFSSKLHHCGTGNFPLTSSDRDKVFIIDTYRYSTEMVSTVWGFGVYIRIYSVLNSRNPVLAKTLDVFFD